MRSPAELHVPTIPPGQGRILLRLPNWLGDVVMAAPTVAAIHAARPQAELIAQVSAPFVSVAALLPGVSRAVPAARDGSPRGLWSSRRALRELDLDAVVLFPRSLRSALAPWLARVPVRLGFAAPGRRLTHPIRGWRPHRRGHRSDWFGLLARAFEQETAGPWRIDVPQPARDQARELLAGLGRREERPLVVLEPGASYGPAKCWPAEHFGALGARLAEAGFDVVTVGTEATRSREDEVARNAGGVLLRAAGRTPDLMTLAGLLSEARLVISNDTGPMHLAAATGVPVLCLFGATDPVVSSPLGTAPRHLLYDPEPCSPCFLRTCPVPGHPCLSKIGVARVFRHAQEMLDEPEMLDETATR